MSNPPKKKCVIDIYSSNTKVCEESISLGYTLKYASYGMYSVNARHTIRLEVWGSLRSSALMKESLET